MFQYLSQDITLLDASMEIGIILFGTFILGMMLGWLIKPNYPAVAEDILEELPEIKPSYVHIKKTSVSKKIEENDLKIIEGITPKIEKLLQSHKVFTFQDILREDVTGLEAILLEGGAKFQEYSPTTWPDQARLAATEKWSELEEYQEILKGLKHNKK